MKSFLVGLGLLAATILPASAEGLTCGWKMTDGKTTIATRLTAQGNYFLEEVFIQNGQAVVHGSGELKPMWDVKTVNGILVLTSQTDTDVQIAINPQKAVEGGKVSLLISKGKPVGLGACAAS